MSTLRKLAIITPLFPSEEEKHRGSFVYQETKALQRQVPVSVYCINVSTPSWQKLRRTHHPPQNRHAIPGTPVKFLTFPSIPWLSRGLNGYLCYRTLRPYILADAPDAITAYWVYPHGYAATLLGNELGIPVAIKALGSDLKRIADPFTRWMTKKTLRRAQSVKAVSEDLRRSAIQLGCAPDRVHTILNGCNHNLFQTQDRRAARKALNIPLHSELIVFVGWLIRSKGIFELVEALAKISPGRPELRTVFIGDGTDANLLKEKIHQYGLDSRVSLRGRMNPGEVAEWLAASNLLCLPSHSEGCPNVVIEALCSGRPVVASAIGGIPELIDSGCGILTPVRQPGALAAALEKCLTMNWNERRIAERHKRTWDDVAADTLNLLGATCYAQHAAG